MPVEISQPADLAPGQALLTVTGVGELEAGALAFAIEQPARGYLQRVGGEAGLKDAFGTTKTWLEPASARPIPPPGGIALLLGPEQTWHLKPHVTYLLRVRDGVHPEPPPIRMAWRAIRLPSQPPMAIEEPTTNARPPGDGENSKTVDDGGVDPPLPPRPSPTRRPQPRLWALLALLLLLLVGGGGAWFALRDRPEAKPPPLPTVATARSFLQTTEDGPKIYDEAQRYMRAGTPDAVQGALILLNRAAQSGSGPAQTALGRMYDPDTFRPETSAMKMPDPDDALLWYQRAAQSNDPEGLYRLGKLLISGRASAPGLGPEQGVTALQRAAALGSSDAKAELDKLKPDSGGKANP